MQYVHIGPCGRAMRVSMAAWVNARHVLVPEFPDFLATKTLQVVDVNLFFSVTDPDNQVKLSRKFRAFGGD